MSRVAHLGVELAEVADVVVVEEDVEVAVQLAVGGQQLVAETRVLADQVVEDLADGRTFGRDVGHPAGRRAKDGGQADIDRHGGSPEVEVVGRSTKTDRLCRHCRTTGSSSIFPS